jgi:hypothetical protein
MDTATVTSVAILGSTSGGTSTVTLNGGASTSRLRVDSSGTTVTGRLTANSFYFSAGYVSNTGVVSNAVGYTSVSSCSQVSTGIYKITFASAHRLGTGYYNTQLCGADGYYTLRGNGQYASTSTALYVRVLDGNGTLSSAGFFYMIL